jgi:hypothetical protein
MAPPRIAMFSLTIFEKRSSNRFLSSVEIHFLSYFLLVLDFISRYSCIGGSCLIMFIRQSHDLVPLSFFFLEIVTSQKKVFLKAL